MPLRPAADEREGLGELGRQLMLVHVDTRYVAAASA
jgi:hypothetical protein